MITIHPILQLPSPRFFSAQKSRCLTFFIRKKKDSPYQLPTKKMEFGIVSPQKL